MKGGDTRTPNNKGGAAIKSGPKRLEDLEVEGKLAIDRLEDIANYMGDYGDIVDEYAVSAATSRLHDTEGIFCSCSLFSPLLEPHSLDSTVSRKSTLVVVTS